MNFINDTIKLGDNMKLLKNNIKLFIGIVIGAVISGISVYALSSNSVAFTPTDTNWNVSTVDEAINDLYEVRNQDLIDRLDLSMNVAHAERNISTANTNSVINNLSGDYLVVWTESVSNGSETGISNYADISGNSLDQATIAFENGTCEHLLGKYSEKTAVTPYSGSWKMWTRVYLKVYKCSFDEGGIAKLQYTNGSINTYNSRGDILTTIKID